MLKKLTENKLITKEQAQLIDKLHHRTKKNIDVLLEEYGYISGVVRAKIMAEHHEVEFVNLNNVEITKEALECISHDVALKNTILPLYIKNKQLFIAIDESSDFSKLTTFEYRTKMSIKFVYADTEQLVSQINSVYKGVKSLHVSMYDFDSSDVISLLNSLLNSAIEHQASDIHFSPEHDALHISFRIDGLLQHMAVIDLDMLAPLSVRIKNLSDLDMSQKRIALDGSFSYSYLNKDFDFRVSTLPTDMGENIAMRILSKDANLFELDLLGLNDENLKKIKTLIHKPHGAILLTGPTGSGKTTTLYATLNEINRLQKNILTIENPIEYRFPFIKQTQYNPKAGYTYDMAIKSFMRQDPDVILVGEVRDSQTAKLAMEASMTGHIVLSTLHTNDAISAIARLKSLDVPAYLIGGGLLAVIAQRLVRKLCSHCKEVDTSYEEGAVYKAKGCDRCFHTGYKGRLAIVEIVHVDRKMQGYITENATQNELYLYAREQGMQTLQEDAHQKVLNGETSFEEIQRHVF